MLSTERNKAPRSGNSPKLFRRKPEQSLDPSTLVKQLFDFKGSDESMAQFVKAQSNTVLWKALPLVVRQLLDIKLRINETYTIAWSFFPTMSETSVNTMLAFYLNNKTSESSPDGHISHLEDELSFRILIALTKKLSVLIEISDKLISIGNKIHQKLTQSGYSHTRESLLDSDDQLLAKTFST
jgi:hypothetical protein